MARLYTSGFEYNDLLNDGIDPAPINAPTIVSSPVRSGSFAGKCDSGVANASVKFGFPSGIPIVANTSYFIRCYYCFAQLPAAGNFSRILGVLNSFTNLTGISITDAGALRSDIAGSSDSPAIIVADSTTWYRIELSFVTDASNHLLSAECLLNGSSFASGVVGSALTPNVFQCGWLTTNDASHVLYVDDIAMNDSTGGSQTGYPGSGKVVLLKPTADSAVGTGWTLGTGTAIAGGSGSTAVKNTPPVGVADLTAGSDTKQIRNATSSANVNYDATMTTYTAAGVGARDIVQVVVPIVATAAPVTTSAKQGTVGVVSNPAITNIALGAGGTAGAFWSGLAGGAYPSGWKISLGTTTYLPSVTKGTAPVMRITQVTASTRIADVCSMGIYVEYLPYTPSLVTDSTQRRLAHRHHTMDRW